MTDERTHTPIPMFAGKTLLITGGTGSFGHAVLDRVLDFACSIYYFQTLPDAQTIEFGVRFTGCFPTAVPFSPWNARLGNSEGVKVSVPYTYAYMEPMEPRIFMEFNSSAGSSGVSVGETALPDSKRKVYSLNFSEGKTLENFL